MGSTSFRDGLKSAQIHVGDPDIDAERDFARLTRVATKRAEIMVRIQRVTRILGRPLNRIFFGLDDVALVMDPAACF